MKYTYCFMTGETQEIDVTEDEYLALKEADRLDYNNDHANTRRHISLETATAVEGMQFSDPASVVGEVSRLQAALERLSPAQQQLIRAIYLENVPVCEFAAICGVGPSAISHRIRTAEKKLRKILSDPQF